MFFYARLFRELLVILDPKFDKANTTKTKLEKFSSAYNALENKIRDGNRRIFLLNKELSDLPWKISNFIKKQKQWEIEKSLLEKELKIEKQEYLEKAKTVPNDMYLAHWLHFYLQEYLYDPIFQIIIHHTLNKLQEESNESFEKFIEGQWKKLLKIVENE